MDFFLFNLAGGLHNYMYTIAVPVLNYNLNCDDCMHGAHVSLLYDSNVQHDEAFISTNT